MPLSTASVLLLHAFLLATTVSSAATSILPVEHGDVINTTTTFTNSSATTSSPDDDRENFEQYLCFLCSGRDLLAIHHCPIYWDECHLICDDDMSSTTTVVPAIPTATTDDAAPAAPVSPASSTTDHDDCYVMKLYVSGRYVIVEHRPCKYIAWCYLICGGGELEADRRKVVMGGTATTAVSTMTAAAIQGSFLPAAELCGTQQVHAPWAPLPPSAGVVVPAGGAHRRR